jgi:DNA repair ATPase RecN
MLQTNESRLTGCEGQLRLDTLISQLFQAVSEQSQSQMSKIEIICSDALKEIMMDPDMEFKIKTERKRNAIDTFFYVKDKKSGELDLMQCEAGAVKNIVSTAIRLVFIELYSPKIDGPILLDEVGGNVSIDFQENFGKFLRRFSLLTSRQIILISHQRAVFAEAGHLIVVSKEKNISEVRYGSI